MHFVLRAVRADCPSAAPLCHFVAERQRHTTTVLIPTYPCGNLSNIYTANSVYVNFIQ